MERIVFNNLDLGYDQCQELNDLVANEGEPLLEDLANNVLSLQAHWIGSDATKHINNLIVVTDALQELLKEAKKSTSVAGDSIIEHQEVRKANGGNGPVGTKLSNSIKSVSTIAKNEDTSEYYVDPAAQTDYNNLESECGRFTSFVDSFKSVKDELFGNWKEGPYRSEAESAFNSFMENAETYKKYMGEARDNLSIAVSNISQIGS